MNKNEAIKAMEQGAKVTHRFFEPSEWAILNTITNEVEFEDGSRIVLELFIKDRQGEAWETGWSIWEAAPSTPVNEVKETDDELRKKSLQWWVNLGHEIAANLRDKYYPNRPLLTADERLNIYLSETRGEDKQPESKQPLYKVLNEKREPNKWILGGCSGRMITTPTGYIGDGFLADFDTKANAEYTALCVNNLASLAEALEKMCEWHEKQSTWDKGDNGYYNAKQALSSIS